MPDARLRAGHLQRPRSQGHRRHVDASVAQVEREQTPLLSVSIPEGSLARGAERGEWVGWWWLTAAANPTDSQPATASGVMTMAAASDYPSLGSQTSAMAMARWRLSLPPMTRTRPSGKAVAV